MKKQTKLLILVSAGVILFTVLMQVYIKGQSQNIQQGTDNSVPGNRNSELDFSPSLAPEGVTVKITFGSLNAVSGKVSARTAFEALKKVGADKKIDIVSKESAFGVMVSKIGDLENSANKYWLYTVNGKLAQVASDKFAVRGGDVIEWNYGDGK